MEARADGGKVASAMQDYLRQIDATRPVTCNADLGNVFAGINGAMEVRGWSYHIGPAMDAYHKEHPSSQTSGASREAPSARAGSTPTTRCGAT